MELDTAEKETPSDNYSAGSEGSLACPPCGDGELDTLKGIGKGGFQGYCNFCWKWGHRKSECRSYTTSLGKGGGKGDGKGKGEWQVKGKGKGKDNWNQKGKSKGKGHTYSIDDDSYWSDWNTPGRLFACEGYDENEGNYLFACEANDDGAAGDLPEARAAPAAVVNVVERPFGDIGPPKAARPIGWLEVVAAARLREAKAAEERMIDRTVSAESLPSQSFYTKGVKLESGEKGLKGEKGSKVEKFEKPIEIEKHLFPDISESIETKRKNTKMSKMSRTKQQKNKKSEKEKVSSPTILGNFEEMIVKQLREHVEIASKVLKMEKSSLDRESGDFETDTNEDIGDHTDSGEQGGALQKEWFDEEEASITRPRGSGHSGSRQRHPQPGL